uniref:PBPb domain-containing protein n=1 Tax=Rhabditophanes sp. KR3021 TaxID=114890 RepID=A0AC35U1K5_9BILA
MNTPNGTFKIGVFENEPDIFNCFRNLPRKKCQRPGVEMEIIEIVMRLLGWNWEVIDIVQTFNADPSFGDKYDNGTYNGLIGLLEEGKIDMGAPSMKITIERLDRVIFTSPLRFFQQVYFVSTPTENDFTNFIFGAFTTQVWMFILATVFIVILLEYIILCLEKQENTWLKNLSDAVIEPLTIILRQTVRKHRSRAHWVFQGTLLITFVVLYVYFQSIASSKLTAQKKMDIPFESQKGFLDLLQKRDHYFPVYWRNETPECSNKANCQRMDHVFKMNPVRVGKSLAQITDLIHEGGIFYADYDVDLVPKNGNNWSIRDNITIIKDINGLTSYGAFAFRKQNIRLRNAFNNMLARTIGGMNQISSGVGYNDKIIDMGNTIVTERVSLSLFKHLEQLVLIYFFGIGISIAICCIEIIISHAITLKKILFD